MQIGLLHPMPKVSNVYRNGDIEIVNDFEGVARFFSPSPGFTSRTLPSWQRLSQKYSSDYCCEITQYLKKRERAKYF